MENFAPEANIECLRKIYALYDKQIKRFDVVCQKKCSSCCTCNVTLTGLEASYLTASLTQEAKKNLQTMIKTHFPKKRYIPRMTTNMFAKMCMEGKELPEEENDPSWGKCPLLVDDMCSIYEFRPFGCRALMSQVHCQKKGYAQIPPMVLTMNNVFLQYIEHMDESGIFSNLSDMLELLLSSEMTDNFSDQKKIPDTSRFLSNEKISVLMVEPQHREKIRSLLDTLSFIIKKN